MSEDKQQQVTDSAEVQEQPKSRDVFKVNWPIDLGDGVVLEPGKSYNAKKLKLSAKQVKALKEQGAIE